MRHLLPLLLLSACADTHAPGPDGDVAALTVVVQTDRALADVVTEVEVSVDGEARLRGVPEGFYVEGATMPPFEVEVGSRLVVVRLYNERGVELAADSSRITLSADRTLRFEFEGGCLGGCRPGEVCAGGVCRDECDVDPTRCECFCASDSDCPTAECGAIVCRDCLCIPEPDDADCMEGETCESGVCVGGVDECDCADAPPCGPPPPFGCAATMRVRGDCFCQTAVSNACDGACDPDTLECVPGRSLTLRLRTDIPPGSFDEVEVRFDGVLAHVGPVSGGAGTYEVGTFRVPQRHVEVELRVRGCGEVIASRTVRGDGEGDHELTVAITGT